MVILRYTFKTLTVLSLLPIPMLPVYDGRRRELQNRNKLKFLSYLLRQHTKKCSKKCSNLRIISRLISRYFPWKIGDNLIIPISISSLSKHYSLTSAKKPCTGFFDDLENLD